MPRGGRRATRQLDRAAEGLGVGTPGDAIDARAVIEPGRLPAGRIRRARPLTSQRSTPVAVGTTSPRGQRRGAHLGAGQGVARRSASSRASRSAHSARRTAVGRPRPPARSARRRPAPAHAARAGARLHRGVRDEPRSRPGRRDHEADQRLPDAKRAATADQRRLRSQALEDERPARDEAGRPCPGALAAGSLSGQPARPSRVIGGRTWRAARTARRRPPRGRVPTHVFADDRPQRRARGARRPCSALADACAAAAA